MVLPWAVAFVVLTVAGERLELARVAVLDRDRLRGFVAFAWFLFVTCPAALLWPDVGTPALGLALLLLVAWLVVNDVARRTVRSHGQTRFMAVCLLAGYGWLAVAGAIWLLTGPAVDGPRYDAVVHAVFLGFTLSMIMAHAPVILLGDARDLTGGWQVGGALGVAAILLFAAVTVRTVLGAAR